MIPKVIHYCWFGGGEKSKLIQKCIKSWKKFCPEYPIIEWNESNFPLASAPPYVRQAYEAKKWAYVADYARLKILFDGGGVYMDTDVELCKPLDALLAHRAYFGFETAETINTGLGFGAEKGLPLLLEMMEQYEHRSFRFQDGQYLTCPLIDTEVFVKKGLRLDGTKQLLEGDILVLPMDYLCPKSLLTEWITKTENTVSVHHFTTSWFSEEQREHHKKVVKEARRATKAARRRSLPKRMLRRLLGNKLYEKIKKKARGCALWKQ